MINVNLHLDDVPEYMYLVVNDITVRIIPSFQSPQTKQNSTSCPLDMEHYLIFAFYFLPIFTLNS